MAQNCPVNEVNMGEEEEESIDRTCKDVVILGKISKVKITKTEGKNLPNYCFDRATKSICSMFFAN